jgi:hypothetical protein
VPSHGRCSAHCATRLQLTGGAIQGVAQHYCTGSQIDRRALFRAIRESYRTLDR